jgi:hypothetical protein
VPELLYLSSAKLSRWPRKTSVRASLSRRLGGELGGGGIPAKVTVAPEDSSRDKADSLQAEYDHARRVLKELAHSHRFARWVTDGSVGPGQYIEFGGLMRYGRIRRDTRATGSSAPSANIIFFAGAFDEPDPSVDVLLGGWIGHVVEQRGVLDVALRMGSQTEHLYDLWDELVAAERDGTFEVPEVWRRLRREPAPDASPTLASLSRSVYGWMSEGLPSANLAFLKGFAQVLDRLDDGGYERPLILGTPLIVEFSARTDV